MAISGSSLSIACVSKAPSTLPVSGPVGEFQALELGA